MYPDENEVLSEEQSNESEERHEEALHGEGADDRMTNEQGAPDEGQDDEAQDSQEDELEGEEEPRRTRQHNRMRPKNSQELFLQAIPERSRDASVHLRMHLSGKVLFVIQPAGEKYLIDWSNEQLVCQATDGAEAACSISLSESDVMKIASGDLNPQVAMLSHKIKVHGSTDHAMYVFNLIAPSTGF